MASMNDGKTSKLPVREYPAGSKIRIRVVRNANKAGAFGLSHQVEIPPKLVGGGTSRKKFKDKADAERYAFDCWTAAKRYGQSFFELTDAQRQEATLAFAKLSDAGLSLTEAVAYAITNLRPAGKGKTVAEVAEEVVASKKVRYERGDLRERSYRDFRHRVNRFGENFSSKMIHDVSTKAVKDWVFGLGHNSTRTNKNDLSALGEVFKYARQQRYISENPIDFLSDVDRRLLCGSSGEAKEPDILTIEQAEKLLTTARSHPELEMLPAVILGLFCGLRTEEIKRLDWKAVHLSDDTPVVTIGAAIAKKRRIRHVDIPINAKQWLSLVAKDSGPVAPNGHFNQFQKQFQKLLKLAGWGKVVAGKWKSNWGRNAMRHSFGTYHFAKTGDAMETSRLLGHTANDTVLFANYRALASKDQGKAFFSIKPSATAAKVVEFSA